MQSDPTVNPASPPEPLSLMAERILEYLRNHPQARDSVEGIAEWWLLEQKIREATRDVDKALTDLVKRGLVSEQCGTSTRFYGLK